MGDWLSTGEAAKKLGVDPTTVIRYAEGGKVGSMKLPSGHRRIKREDVERILREQGKEKR